MLKSQLISMRLKSIVLLVFILNLSFAEAQINKVFDIYNDVNHGTFDSGRKTYFWNNGILVLGYCNNESLTLEGLTLSYYDTLGNIIWNKVYIDQEFGHIQGNDLCFFDNSYFYVAGVNYKDSINEEDMFVAKFNAAGDSVFYKFFNSTLYTYPFQIIPWAQDTLLVYSVEKEHSSDIYTKMVFTKIDTSGNIISITSTSQSLETGYQIIKGNDNRMYVGGTRRTSASSNYNIKAFVKVFDYDLNYIGYMVPPSALNSRFISLSLINDYIYLISKEDLDYWTEQVRLTRFSDINVAGRDTSALVGPADMFVSAGNLISNGSTLLLNMDSLYFFDLELNKICSTSLNTPTGDYSGLGYISLTYSNKIIGTGRSQIGDDARASDHWVFLTVPFTDNLREDCVSDIEILHYESQSNFEIYPTIFDSEINIIDKNCFGSHSTIQIYNLLGICVYEGILDCVTKINSSDYGYGCYVLRINYGKNYITKMLIKIE